MKPIFIRAALGGFMVLGFLILAYIGGAFMSGLLVVLGMVTLLWVLSLYLKDSGIVDIFWGFGFVVMVWY
jgi:steroid 5-alpha reductase family enzyme